MSWQAEERLWLLICPCPAADEVVGPDLPTALGAAQRHWEAHWTDGWLD